MTYSMRRELYESGVPKGISGGRYNVLQVGIDIDVDEFLEVLLDTTPKSDKYIVVLNYEDKGTTKITTERDIELYDHIHICTVMIKDDKWSVVHNTRLPSEFYDIRLYMDAIDTNDTKRVVDFITDSIDRILIIQEGEELATDSSIHIDNVLESRDDEYVRMVFDPRKVRRFLKSMRESSGRKMTRSEQLHAMETEELIQFLKDRGVDVKYDVKSDPNPPAREVPRNKGSLLVRAAAVKGLGAATKSFLDKIGVKFF